MQNSEASVPTKAPPLKSPWAAIVRSEPKQKDSASVKTTVKSQMTKQGSNVSAASSKQDSQTALPSYAQAGASQRHSSPSPAESKQAAQTATTDRQSPEAQPVEVDKHAPATPAASTSPVPASDSSSSTAEKFREDGNAAEASTSRGSEVEVIPRAWHAAVLGKHIIESVATDLHYVCRLSHPNQSRWLGTRSVCCNKLRSAVLASIRCCPLFHEGFVHYLMVLAWCCSHQKQALGVLRQSKAHKSVGRH